MKRKYVTTVALVCLIMTFSSFTVFADETATYSTEFSYYAVNSTRASDVISSYLYFTEAKGNNNVYVYADLYTLYKGVLTAQIVLQSNEDGVWKYVTSWDKNVSDSNGLVFSTTYSGIKSKQYRAIVYYTANANGKYDSRTVTSNTCTAY